MKRTKMEKGITLVALIITIVILLILAVVAISSITNEGILSYAESAAKGYNNAATNEQGFLDGYEGILNKYSNGETVGGGTGDDTPVEEESTYTVSGIWDISWVSFSTMSATVNFTSNGTNYTSISVGGDESYYTLSYGNTTAAYWEPMAGIPNEWYNQNYSRIDFGTEPQEVSKEFYEWLDTCANKLVLTDENSVSGVWVFDERFPNGYSDNQRVEVNFTSNNKQYDSIYPGWGDAKSLYYGSDAVWWNDMAINLDRMPEPAGWQNEAYKTIDFGSERQEVPNGFLYWLNNNATKQ